MTENAALDGRGAVASIAAFVGLSILYLLTAPTNHSLSWDAYWLAQIITSDQIADVPQPRLFLWIAVMRAFYSASALVITDPDPFRLIGLVNAIQAALAVTLFARLLMRDLWVNCRSAWLSAGLLGASYGPWRYATEIEVYATAMLLSVVLLLTAFSIDRSAPTRLVPRVLALACLGGLVTLVYQPIGLAAGVALPFYLLMRLRLIYVALYCAVAGVLVIVGFSAAYQLGADTQDVDAVAFVLDTERIPSARVPNLAALPKAVYAIGHDFLSTNWSHAFEPFQSMFAQAAPNRSFAAEIFAAEQAGWIVWAAAFTLPSAGLLLLVVIWVSARQPRTAGADAREAMLAVWLIAHAGMMLVLSPAGEEGWILALVPIMAIAARRVVSPTVAAGRSSIVLLLVVVFIVHNGLAGIGVLAREAGDYLRVRGGPMVERTGSGDLIVMAHDWKLDQFVRYAGMAQTLRVKEAGIEEVRRAVEATLADGGRVLIVDDISSAPAQMLAKHPTLALDSAALLQTYRGAMQRLSTRDAGRFYEIEPEEHRR